MCDFHLQLFISLFRKLKQQPLPVCTLVPSATVDAKSCAMLRQYTNESPLRVKHKSPECRYKTNNNEIMLRRRRFASLGLVVRTREQCFMCWEVTWNAALILCMYRRVTSKQSFSTNTMTRLIRRDRSMPCCRRCCCLLILDLGQGYLDYSTPFINKNSAVRRYIEGETTFLLSGEN